MFNRIERNEKYANIANISDQKLYLVAGSKSELPKNGYVKQKSKEKISEMLEKMLNKKLSSKDIKDIEKTREILTSNIDTNTNSSITPKSKRIKTRGL